ncbi:MAG: hypothetical protein WCF98_11560 [Synechococcus sp. ELA057]
MSIPILLADLTLKVLQLPRNSARTMLLAGSSLHSDPSGYRRYESHRQLEQTAVYGTSIAYRYRYSSNNLGLISTPDIQPGQHINLAIAGDSFSEGQGGYPWVIPLQREWLQRNGLRSINYAIAGSGFGDFAATARVARQQHRADKVLILFIEHDAYRPYQLMGSNQACSFYSNGILDHLLGPFTCNLYGIVWHHVPAGLTDQQVIRASLARQNYGVFPALNALLLQISQQISQKMSPSVSRPNTASAPRGGAQDSAPLRYGPLPQASIEAIQTITRLYGRDHVLMVQLPDQPGAASAANKGSRLHFQRVLHQATGLTVLDLASSCRLSQGDFHQLDSHPNSKGYAKLASCVRDNPRIRAFVEAETSAPTL